MRPFLLTALLLLASAARGADLDPEGALARWLDGTAGPELAEVLARHPRFAGETLGFVAIVDGAPTRGSDPLRDAVERRLRRHLLRAEGVRVALPGGAGACGTGADPQLLIGIEIVSRTSRAATVSIGVIDAVEGVWVSGVAHDWRGSLSSAERRALATTATVRAGERPVPVADADAVAEALAVRLDCAWPGGLGGRVHLAAGTGSADAARVAAALRGRLGRGPAVIVADPTEADWRLVVEVGGPDAPDEARLGLVSIDERPAQQLASVFVTRGADTAVVTPAIVSPTPVPVADRPAPVLEPDPFLLRAARLEQVPRDGVCRRGGRDVLCAELAVEMVRPGWLFVLSTRDGRARPLACDARPLRSEAGVRRFRFAVGDADVGRPDTGVYLLAVRDRDVSRDIAAMLRAAPGACGTRDARPLDHWLADLSALLVRHGSAIDWQAVHLVRDGDQVVRI